MTTPKDELREAAEEYADSEVFKQGTPTWADKFDAFLAGAKWMNERCSREAEAMAEKRKGAAERAEAAKRFGVASHRTAETEALADLARDIRALVSEG